jgi:hypothetical protein
MNNLIIETLVSISHHMEISHGETRRRRRRKKKRDVVAAISTIYLYG